MTVLETDYLVVGAGPAGLGSAGELHRRGVAAVVLERSDSIGSSWRSRYDRLRLNTSRLPSKLPGARYPRGTPLFPPRDQYLRYLEEYAERNDLDVRLQTRVERIERDGGSWLVRSTGGEFRAAHLIVAMGYDHTPVIPDWPGREHFPGQLFHAAEYRNARPFRGRDVLVVGPGSSGVEIAYELVSDGAARVRLAVRTPPSIVLRAVGGLPGDLAAIAMWSLPHRLADAQMKVMRRLTIGDLSDYGLPLPEVGPFQRLAREGKAPAAVDREMIDAIRDGRITIVPGVASLEARGVRLANGELIHPEAVIAATGYRRGLEPLVGHLGVLDERGLPRVIGGGEAAPGLRFVGYDPSPVQLYRMRREACRAAKAIARQLRARASSAEPVASA